MEREEVVIEQICAGGLLPLFYNDEEETCIKVVKALYDGGIRTIEFTNRGKNSLNNFKALVAVKAEMPGLLLGIGTIKTGEQANSFIDAGADFLVSPVFDATVSDVAYMQKIAWIPGCMTPTEIHTAQQAGCRLVKLFPGNALGPGFVEAIKPVFSGIRFVVTGGVDATKENIELWMKSGVAGVGLGSKLITPAILQSGNFEQLTTTAASLVSIIQQIK
jgi:2-dehydro-3-deoxyphosphogluconate aldolase/(4S)-4-hydroxy-2-oxoglutarate aldolase